jgi:tetratricopeptide (TPR) repeat protein
LPRRSPPPSADAPASTPLAGQHDRAREEMARAIEDMRREDADDLVYLYESKAVLEHSVAAVHEKQARPDSAREAYGRALREDLAFHPAHVRLAALALAAGDTAAAVGEMDLAVQLAPEDGALRHDYAGLLISARKYPEAVEELKKAAELEPWFAAPRLLLGKIHDASGLRLETVRNYKDFLARASKADAQRAWTETRLAAIEAALAAEAGGGAAPTP